MEEELEQTEEIQEETEEPGKSKQKRKKRRNPLVQLQESIDDLAEMAKDSTLKPNNRSDLQLRRADAILSLAKLSADKANSDALAENATLKQERDEKDARISALEAEVSTWRAKAGERLVQVVPDPRLAESISEGLAKDDLLSAVAVAIKSAIPHPQRIALGAKLLMKSNTPTSRGFVYQFTDAGSIICAMQMRTEELFERISLAAPMSRGDGVLTARAVLESRGEVVPEVGSGKPNRYADIFTELDGK
jgi:hypothetical protein